MRLFTVLLEGPVGTPLTYNIGLLDDLFEGQWELAVSSVGFNYTGVTSPSVLKIQCNCVTGKFVDARSQLYTAESVLNIAIFGGKAVGTKIVIGMKQRDFFGINTPQQILRVSLIDVETNTFVNGSAKAIILMVFRRVA